jgi:DNA-binding FadR family transcriptional regulator
VGCVTVRRRKTRPLVGHRIIKDLEAAILGGMLGSGGRLPTEEELAGKYGASRAAVREAVQVLKARGLVESRRGSGSYVVADGGARTLHESLERYAALRGDVPAYVELMDLRLLVETFCVRRLALTEQPEPRASVRDCLARMIAAGEDLKRFGEEDIAFHQAIVEGAGHGLFTTIFRGLLPGLGRRFARATYTDTALIKKTLRDHRKIVAAIDARDANEAETSLRAHLAWSRDNLDQVLGSRSSDGRDRAPGGGAARG